MRFSHKVWVIGVAVAMFATSALATPNVVGRWVGKFQMDMSKMPKPTTPAQQKQMADGMKQAEKIRITLNLNANKTFKATITGSPTASDDKEPSTGTWSIAGNTITIVPNKDKKGHQDPPQKLTVSPNGKKLTLSAPGGQGAVVFMR